MVYSHPLPSDSDLLQIIFCSCVDVSTPVKNGSKLISRVVRKQFENNTRQKTQDHLGHLNDKTLHWNKI